MKGLRHWLAGRTLRWRLVVGMVALFVVACVAVGYATSAALGAYLTGRLDQDVKSAEPVSLALENEVLGEDAQGPGDQSPGPGRVLGPQPGESAGTFAAWIEGHRVGAAAVETSKGLATVSLSRAAVRTVLAVPANGQPVTQQLPGLGRYRLVANPGDNGDVHVAGLPLSQLEDTLHHLELIEIIVFGSALALVACAVAVFVPLSLRPLGRVTATAAEVAALPLASGEVDLPHRVPGADPRTEVGRLGAAFNRMLGHVERALTRRQASEDRLRRFVADASHELRTPLSGIRAYTELALRQPEETATALQRVAAESERMSALVEDLLLLARLDAGRPLAAEPVDLTRLVADATNDARVAGPRHHWHLELGVDPVAVRGDERRLHQVVANLLANARSHTPAGTTVTVRLGTEGGQAVLTVADDGPGIPARLQPDLFQRFVRGDESRSPGPGSTGLGLAIVQAVTTAHRGRVDVASRPGETTFRIFLPLQNGAGPIPGP